MGPLRRNPQSIRAKEIKLDSKAVSVKLMMSQNPEDLLNDRAPDLSSCKLDHEKMRYNPIRIRFYHYDQQTSLRKLLWHEDDLDTNVSFNFICLFFYNLVFVRNHVKLLHVYKSRRGFFKGTVLCGGY